MKSSRSEKSSQIPWLAVILIIFIGVAASLLIFLLRQPTDKTAKNENASSGKTYTVTFFDTDETELSTETVPEGKPAHAPASPQTDLNTVFRGWDIELSEIYDSYEVHPLLEDLSQEENALYIDTQYLDGGTDFWVDLNVCGKVDLTRAKFSVEFDPEIMSYLGCDEDPGLYSPEKESKSVLLFECFFDETLHQPRTLARLHFQLEDVSMIYSTLPFEIRNLETTQNGKTVRVNGEAVNAELYIY